MIPITGHTQLTALLGSPVAHSISPLMHNEAFHLLDLDYTYLCFNVNEENLESFPFTKEYPFSPEGQALFVKNLLRLSKEHGLCGVFWWEPLWIPGDGICWASEAGQEYIGESGKSTRNEWANQCLFDYGGNKLPSFDEFNV